MLAYSLFTLSALHALFMGFVEHRLHRNPSATQQSSLPSLLSMETLALPHDRDCLSPVDTLTHDLLRLFFSEQIFGKALVVFDHKTLFAFAS